MPFDAPVTTATCPSSVFDIQRTPFLLTRFRWNEDSRLGPREGRRTGRGTCNRDADERIPIAGHRKRLIQLDLHRQWCEVAGRLPREDFRAAWYRICPR